MTFLLAYLLDGSLCLLSKASDLSPTMVGYGAWLEEQGYTGHNGSFIMFPIADQVADAIARWPFPSMPLPDSTVEIKGRPATVRAILRPSIAPYAPMLLLDNDLVEATNDGEPTFSTVEEQ